MKAVVLAVALSGCWHFSGAGEPPPTESRVASDDRADAGRADAGRRDAGRADAGRRDAGRADAGRAGTESVGADEADGPLAADVPGLPGPRRRAPPVNAGAVAAPPGCVVGRVIAMTVANSEVVLVVGVGLTRGVARSWTATLPGQPQASVLILRVEKTVTVLRVLGVTLDAIRGAGIAVLCP